MPSPFETNRVSTPLDPNDNDPIRVQEWLAAGLITPEEASRRITAGATAQNERFTRQGMKPLPADTADIVLRDASGFFNARRGSTSSALGLAGPQLKAPKPPAPPKNPFGDGVFAAEWKP